MITSLIWGSPTRRPEITALAQAPGRKQPLGGEEARRWGDEAKAHRQAFECKFIWERIPGNIRRGAEKCNRARSESSLVPRHRHCGRPEPRTCGWRLWASADHASVSPEAGGSQGQGSLLPVRLGQGCVQQCSLPSSPSSPTLPLRSHPACSTERRPHSQRSLESELNAEA